MNISIKTPAELKIIRQAGKIQAQILQALGEALRPDLSTQAIADLARQLCKKKGVQPGFLNYQNFPAAVCTSVNDTVVHSIPSKKEILAEGDIIGIDFGALYQGFHTDACQTFAVGKIPKSVQVFLKRVKESLFAGINAARAGQPVSAISRAIQNYIEKFNYGIVRETVGHGIGRELHEDPQVPNFVTKKREEVILQPGMTICIEPIINMQGAKIKKACDGFTLKTVDGSLSAHFEHQVLITSGEPEILTPWHLSKS